MKKPATLAALAVAFIALMGIWPLSGLAQDACKNRGTLDVRFCDENGDLIADQPKDQKQWQNHATLVFSYTPTEDPSVYENVFEDLMQHISRATGKKVRWYPAESYAAQVEAIRSGRLHIAGVASGATPYAVNLGGFQPLVGMARADGSIGYTLQVIVRRDSPIKSLQDLKGKRVAHVTPSSNSGDIAPRALFSNMGIVPGKDYEILFSGKHDNSIMGVVNGDYDAAPVASSVVERMQARGMFKADALRVVYQTAPFPRTAYGVVYNLPPEIKAKVKEAFLSFDFKKSKLAKEFKDIERFAAIDYKNDWRDVLVIQKATGVSYTQDTLKKLGTKAK